MEIGRQRSQDLASGLAFLRTNQPVLVQDWYLRVDTLFRMWPQKSLATRFVHLHTLNIVERPWSNAVASECYSLCLPRKGCGPSGVPDSTKLLATRCIAARAKSATDCPGDKGISPPAAMSLSVAWERVCQTV